MFACIAGLATLRVWDVRGRSLPALSQHNPAHLERFNAKPTGARRKNITSASNHNLSVNERVECVSVRGAGRVAGPASAPAPGGAAACALLVAERGGGAAHKHQQPVLLRLRVFVLVMNIPSFK